ncbi:hypothetical protein KACHI17_05380 [Sediminibacterium sp. KACHI17]|jgi:uncharacterized membrane protein YqaE (UPF0057 family)|uniref:YqaE/Pmp3 family membrane protein n=1 Tax=Sediminibacterium sp. KACHI17 TaxID=1751071 RepID=A0AAT9GGE3_9BACT
MKKISLSLMAVSIVLSANSSITEPTEVISGKKEVTTQQAPVMNDVVVEDAIREFKSLSRTERKARIKEVKKIAREYKAAKKAGSDVQTNTVLLAILAVLLPPLAVGLHQGELNGKFWLSVLLTLLFWLPGVIYALIVVLG